MPGPDPERTAKLLRVRLDLRPSLGIILGSGFHHVLARLQITNEVPFSQAPGFAVPRVSGHSGRVLAGYLGGTPVLVLTGRAHYYEGHSMEQVTFAVRALACFGLRSLLLTSAAGGINRRYRPGDFMSVADHLNFMGENPLRRPVPCHWAGFVDLSRTYDERLRGLLSRAAAAAKVRLHSGVYLAVSGPSYETPAEIAAFARLGADAVGMSTVPEAIVARQHGLTVAGLSCITNRAAGRAARPLSHEEVLATAERVGHSATELLARFAELYGESQ